MINIFKITIISLCSLLLYTNHAHAERYTNISNKQLTQLMKNGVQVYDIRRPEEWKQTGVIPGARLMTYQDANGNLMPWFFERFTKEIPKDKPVVLICRTGNRTSKLAYALHSQYGYSRVYNLQRGIRQWINDGYGTEKQ